MSSTLMWRPAYPQESGDLPFALKKTISRRLWDTDGSCGGGDAIVGHESVEYLLGLQHAGIEGAKELIELIEKHGAVVLWHQH